MKKTGKIKSKLLSPRGESLAETLVAVLISALSLVILAGMITASTRLVSNSRNRIKSYIANENVLVKQENPTAGGTVSIELKTGAGNYIRTKIFDGASEAINVSYYYEGDLTGRDPVVSYKAVD